ncbi:helix-turn-helix domain-containing protein [Brucepastera parasyntrophica]|uniref:helix-turn-helix domain-containing protein n=1 Tax=Brucepastera parasyntrophica TaxID=2880008 RepID=UPI0034E1AB42|nr:helix-turn-helix domain-containing protein [Brucepastera parasyntrophica]
MFCTVEQAAHFLGLENHQVYYLLAMGYIEAIKIGNLWRIVPESVTDYDKRRNSN